MLFVLLLTLVAQDPLATKASSKLFATVDVEIESQSAGKFLRGFAKERELQIVFDPRVSLDDKMQGKYRQTPVEKVLSDAAAFVGARMVVIGDAAYFAPAEVADKIAAQAFHARRAVEGGKDSLRKALLARRSAKWGEDKTAQELVEKLAKELGVEVENAGDLDIKVAPGSATEFVTADLLSLWCAPADRTWRIADGGKKLAVEALPEDARLERTLRGLGPAEAKRRADSYRDLEIAALDSQIKSGTLILKGTWTALNEADRADRIEKLKSKAASVAKTKPGKKKTKGAAVKRYTVNFKNVTLEAFVDSLRDATGREVDIDDKSLEQAKLSRTLVVNCVASGLEFEDLLALALDPAGLTFEKSGEKYTIKAK